MSTRRRVVVVAVCAGLLVAACGDRNKDAIAFDGLIFKARADAVDKRVTLADFTASVQGASASLEGAREAGRYEGTKYCIENYGTSVIDWSVGPDSPSEQLVITDDTLTFRGRCRP